MKKISALLCALALALSLAACGGTPAKEHDEGARALAALPSAEGVCYEGSTEPDFLTDDQKTLYAVARRLSLGYEFPSCFKPGEGRYENDKGWMYIEDAAFASYDDYRALLRMVFTEEYVKALEAKDVIISGDDNKVYVADAGKGSNITYIDSAFELVGESESEITFNIVGRYNDDAAFGEGGDRAKDYTESFPVTMKTENGEWRFDSFSLPQA